MCRRTDAWPAVMSLVRESIVPVKELSVEPPWRFSYECDTDEQALNFFQGTFLIRDDGDECHLAWGLVFDPEPTAAGLDEVAAACAWISEQLAILAASLRQALAAAESRDGFVASRTMRLCLLVVFGLLSLGASACGGVGSGGPPNASESTTTTVAPTTTTTTTTTTAPPAPPTSRGPAPILELNPFTSGAAITVVAGAPPYRGVLGQIGSGRNLVPAVALPPAPAAPGVAPLTGLPLDDPAVANRPAIVAKIDNTAKGRPQEALSLADIVFVTEIEGGFTRLAAVYHSQTPTELGPVRSGRTTDIAVFSSFNTPIFVWSGANGVHLALLRRYNMVDLGAARRTEYYRAANRPGTYDLMTDPTVLWGIAAGKGDGGAPPVHFEYRDDSILLPTSAVLASAVRIVYPSVGVDWLWEAALGFWRRVQNGTPHVDAQNMEVRAANVLVAEVAKITTGAVDVVGSPVVEQQFVGSGRGWVFTDGHAIEVTWTKPSLDSVPTWTTADGVPVALTPGQTWIEFVNAGAVTFS